MKPTPHLRFVQRDMPFTENTLKTVRILQQWWTTSQYVPVEGNPDGCIGEWRDIPLESE